MLMVTEHPKMLKIVDLNAHFLQQSLYRAGI